MKFSRMILVNAAILVPFLGAGQPAFGQGFGMLSQPVPEQKSFPSLSATGGRYVFGQISDSSKDQFMLDTLTGRLWRVAETGAVGLFLQPVPYKSDKGEYLSLPGEPAGAENNGKEEQ